MYHAGARGLPVARISHATMNWVEPPNTEIVASSEFTPYAALGWTDRPAISFQFHPEFSPAFAKALSSWNLSWSSSLTASVIETVSP